MENSEYSQKNGMWDNLKWVVYPGFRPNGDIKWGGEVNYIDVTLIHIVGCESKQEVKTKIAERLKEISLSCSQLANQLGSS